MSYEPGDIIGDYEILGSLGAGGMGQVYRVRHRISDRVEAMKVLLPDAAAAPVVTDRFLREIKVLASLDHPNIARLNTALQVDNQLVMVMELLEGKTLSEIVLAGELTLLERLELGQQVLNALGYAHRRGVVHRDVKPANILRTRDGVGKLMDFGIARQGDNDLLTSTGITVGTAQYMSPEQIRGGALDGRSDLYSFGITLYEAVTGRPPFLGASTFEVMSAHVYQAPVSPAEVNRAVPTMLAQAILQSMEKEPELRFQTAEAFHAALERATRQVLAEGKSGLLIQADSRTEAATVTGAALPARSPAARPAAVPPPPVATAPPKKRRRRWPVVVLLLVLGGVLFDNDSPDEESKPEADEDDLPAVQAPAAPVAPPAPAQGSGSARRDRNRATTAAMDPAEAQEASQRRELRERVFPERLQALTTRLETARQAHADARRRLAEGDPEAAPLRYNLPGADAMLRNAEARLELARIALQDGREMVIGLHLGLAEQFVGQAEDLLQGRSRRRPREPRPPNLP